MKRRDVLKALPIGAAFAAVPFSIGGFAGRAFGRSPLLDALLNPQSTDGKVLVIINLQGGNDGLNMIIPYQDPLYYTNRAKIGFKAADKTMLDGYKLRDTGMVMNPNFDDGASAKFLKLWSDGKLAVLQNVGYADPSLSHFRSTDIWNTASDSEIVLSTGWVGRFLESEYPTYPSNVQVGDDPLAIQIAPSLSPVFQGSSVEMGIAVNDPKNYNAASAYADDPAPATNAGSELEYVRSILTQSDVYGSRFKQVFQGATPPKNKATYPTGNYLADQLKKVALCIAGGMTTKVYFVNLAGFDTHVNQNSTTAAAGQGLLINMLAGAISSFQSDLELLGVADNVVGMTYSEFGRRVNDNDSLGTDHGTAAPMFLFGSQLNGDVYGHNPQLEPANLDTNLDLVWQFDFRQVYASILSDWFGMTDVTRKAVLNDTSGQRFPFDFPVNGSSKTQSLFRNPARQAVDRNAQPENFVLHQNYPNPFNPTTQIKFAIAASAPVVLEVFDARGELMATPIQSRLGMGEHNITFDGSRLASGKYFYRLQVGGAVQTKSMTLVK